METVLKTPRLQMRPHHPTDADFMIRLNADPAVVRYTGDGPLDQPTALAIVSALQQQYAERRMGRFVLTERETGEPVGWCGLKWHPEEDAADLGYRLLRDRWGRGYATEAGRACLQYGRETLNLQNIIARVVPENTASVRVLQKLGFVRVRPTVCDGWAADLYRLPNER